MEANIFDACLIDEELAYGCTGIVTAIVTTNLGVSLSRTIFHFYLTERMILLQYLKI